jgi:hypothetical protein
LEQYEFLTHIVRCLEALNIPYFITGAVASIAYGEPRLTNDIDIVVDLKEDDILQLKKYFPENNFYLDVDTAQKAVRQKRQFNIIHPASGLKADMMIPEKDALDESRFHRIKRLKPTEDTEANFASPEDVIIKKMQFYQEGQSDKHIRDIAGILQISEELIDFSYIDLWAKRLGLESLWLAIRKKIAEIGQKAPE